MNIFIKSNNIKHFNYKTVDCCIRNLTCVSCYEPCSNVSNEYFIYNKGYVKYKSVKALLKDITIILKR